MSLWSLCENPFISPFSKIFSPLGGIIYAYHVHDPERYGVVEFDAQGKVLSIEENPMLTSENPEFERIISGTLRSLPRLQPALKRGMPVSARFRIPLVIQTHE